MWSTCISLYPPVSLSQLKKKWEHAVAGTCRMRSYEPMRSYDCRMYAIPKPVAGNETFSVEVWRLRENDPAQITFRRFRPGAFQGEV